MRFSWLKNLKKIKETSSVATTFLASEKVATFSEESFYHSMKFTSLNEKLGGGCRLGKTKNNLYSMK
ncbi:hypothetical protein VB264_07535 [Arcicella aquatica]|uniref:Uncharacterized protein n=1 Tax=Arcicella aquatica TaxID=217141 RepID=A0ABU5QL24_9BACT|nr:hypothetical protein [Arcicella aquatica]MEA5257630.1 hypothetical protein [Arcicella aquatica]